MQKYAKQSFSFAVFVRWNARIFIEYVFSYNIHPTGSIAVLTVCTIYVYASGRHYRNGYANVSSSCRNTRSKGSYKKADFITKHQRSDSAQNKFGRRKCSRTWRVSRNLLKPKRSECHFPITVETGAIC